MAPTKSSLVLVAGSALKDLQKILKKIDSLSKDMKMIPYVVILLVRDNEMVPDTVRSAVSPPVVSLQDFHLNCILKPFLQVQVQVDRQGSISSSFLFTCYGLPAKSTQLGLVRGRYRPVAGLCQGRQIRVAFNQFPGLFMVNMEDNTMYDAPVWWSVMSAASGSGSYHYEILDTFFDAHQLSPIFMYNNQTWGYFDTEAGLWRGAVAMVRTDIISVAY